MEEFLTIKEIAERWNITGRQVQKCVPKGKYREHRSSEMHGRFRKTLKSQLMEESLLVNMLIGEK